MLTYLYLISTHDGKVYRGYVLARNSADAWKVALVHTGVPECFVDVGSTELAEPPVFKCGI